MIIVDKQEITLTRGDTAYLRFIPLVKEYQTNTWVEKILEEGDRAFFRIKTNAATVLEKECLVEIENNKIRLTIDPEDTIPLDFKTYYYEVELVTNLDEHFTFIAHQRFTVGKEEELHG